MSAGEYCNRDVVVVDKNESVREVAKLMRNHHVGDVVVVEKIQNKTIPLGVFTDRDIVIEILAKDVELDAVKVGDVMSFDLVSVNENSKLLDAIKSMRIKGVRRLVVVNDNKELSGILTVDDVLELISEQLSDIVALVSKEISKEVSTRT